MCEQTLAQTEPVAEQTQPRPTVLIVDDDADQNEVLCHRLGGQGFNTLSAQTGGQGRDVAREQHPDLILLDLRLPDANGMDVCQQLSDDPATCDIPVIILSGLADGDIVRCCRAAGCQFYVRKPYDPNALLTLVRQAIAESQAWE